MKLVTRFFLILVAFSLVPILIGGIWLVKSQAAARENARQLHVQATKFFGDIVESFAGDVNLSVGFVQELERVGLVGGSSANEYKILLRAASTHPSFGILSLIGADGRESVRFADPQKYPSIENEDRSADPLVTQVRTAQTAEWGQVVLRKGTPFIPIAHPLPKGKVLYVEHSLAALCHRFQDQSIGKGGRIFLVDGAGQPLPGCGGDFPNPSWKEKGPSTALSGWLEDVATAKGPMVSAWASCPPLSWKVLSIQPRAEALAVSPNFAAQAAVFLCSLAALVVLCSFWMGWHMARPLQNLIAGAQRAIQHKFDLAVPEIGWGELSILNRSFNVMMKTLNAYQEMQVDRLLEEKAKVESLVHTIPDAIILAGFDGKIVYMNAKAHDLLSGEGGGPATEPRGRTVHNTFREPALREAVLSLLGRKKVSASLEVELSGAPGESRGAFSCRAATVMHNNREVGIVVTLRDITAERDLNRLRDDFYHGVVHDLRGPLTNIDGFIHIMQSRWDKMDATQAATYMGYVRRSAEHMRQLVADILDTAKIESGTMTPLLEPVPVQEFLERTKALYALETERSGMALSFEMGEVPAQTLTCDRKLIERVLMNLVGNALKFTPKEGKVTLRITAAGPDQVEFSVKDTGVGISKDKLDFVFEKFKQMEGAKKSAGYGLGLFICKKIVELHGGRIWAESQSGQGSRFVFLLPLAGSPAALKKA